MHVPAAATVPSGSLDMRYDNEWDPGVFPTVGSQGNFRFEFGLLPRISLGGRGTVATEQGTGRNLAGDLSANVQVLLLEDQRWWPAVAVGLQDFAGSVPFFRSRYVVMSKSLVGRVRGTFGYGRGPHALNGYFGGGELQLTNFLTLVGEYDAHAFNAGARLLPMPRRLESYGIPRPSLELTWSDDHHVAWAIGLRTILGESKYVAQREARAARRYARPGPDAFVGESPQAMSERVQLDAHRSWPRECARRGRIDHVWRHDDGRVRESPVQPRRTRRTRLGDGSHGAQDAAAGHADAGDRQGRRRACAPGHHRHGHLRRLRQRAGHGGGVR